MRIMAKRYPSEQRERAIRMAVDRLGEYSSAWAAAQALGPKLGVGPETLRKWILQAQVDAGERSGPTSVELEEIRRLKAEVPDLKEANEILKAASISSRGNSTLVTADLRSHRRAACGGAWGRVDLSGPA
jgi:transposase-like protein